MWILLFTVVFIGSSPIGSGYAPGAAFSSATFETEQACKMAGENHAQAVAAIKRSEVAWTCAHAR